MGQAFIDPLRIVPDPLPLRELVGCQADESTAVTNSSVAADTTDYSYGTQSLEWTVNIGATGTLTFDLPFSTTVRGGVGLLVKVADLAAVDELSVTLLEDATNGYKVKVFDRAASPMNPHVLVAGEWAYCWTHRDDFTAVNSPTGWNDGVVGSVDEYPVEYVTLECVAAAGETPVINVGRVAAQAFAKAAYIFAFDDGFQSVNEYGLPIFQSYGWRAGLAVNGSTIGNEGGVYSGHDWISTVADLDNLYANGWDIYNHSYAHLTHDVSLSAADQIEDIRLGRMLLEKYGWFQGANLLRAPFNSLDNADHTAATVLAPYCDMISGNTWRTDETPASLQYRTSPWIPRDVMRLPYCEFSGTGTNFTTSQTSIAKAARYRHVLLLYSHGILPDGRASAYDTRTDYITQIMDLVEAQVVAGTAEVITWSEWWRRLQEYKTMFLLPRTA